MRRTIAATLLAVAAVAVPAGSAHAQCQAQYACDAVELVKHVVEEIL